MLTCKAFACFNIFVTTREALFAALVALVSPNELRLTAKKCYRLCVNFHQKTPLKQILYV